jgi:hypothetical protein
MYEGVLSSDLSKRILLGDTDYIDGRLRQMEMTMNAKIQKIEAKSHAEINAKVQEIETKTHNEIQTLLNTIHVLQQKGEFWFFLNTLSRHFKK